MQKAKSPFTRPQTAELYREATVAKNATAAVRPVKVGNFDMTTQEKIVPPIAIYQAADGSMTTEVRLEGETVWLSQKQMAELFDKNIMTVNEHIANVFAEGELEPSATIRKFLMVRQEGKREVKREIEHYNLDVIISVGYRVKSKQGWRSSLQFKLSWFPTLAKGG